MKGFSKHLLFWVTLAMILAIDISNSEEIVYAAEPVDLGEIVDGSLLTLDLETEDTQNSLTRGLLLNKGTAKCINAGEGKVTAAGVTIAHVVCQKLYIDLSLDQYHPDTKSWHTFDLWSVEKDDASLFMDSFTVSVDKGYYYRVRGVHSAKDGDTLESVDTCTDGIWIE